jgi:hypothetical protein
VFELLRPDDATGEQATRELCVDARCQQDPHCLTTGASPVRMAWEGHPRQLYMPFVNCSNECLSFGFQRQLQPSHEQHAIGLALIGAQQDNGAQ